MRRNHLLLSLILAASFALVACAPSGEAPPAPEPAVEEGPADAAAEPPVEPAQVRITVAPTSVPAGSSAEVTLNLEPAAGIQINRYPKIKLEIPALEGSWAEGRVEIGNDSPPPPEKMDSNYFKQVDPLVLDLVLDADVESGTHEVEGRLTYFYCVKASGFCAPARVPVSFQLEVS